MAGYGKYGRHNEGAVSKVSDDLHKNASRRAETIMEHQDESDGTAEIGEWERQLQHSIDKVTKKKIKDFEHKREHRFDIFKMEAKDYDKAKERRRLQKEERAKSYANRKLRALYGTRLSSQILKGVLDDAGDDSSCSHGAEHDETKGEKGGRRARKHPAQKCGQNTEQKDE